jgi:hypothetical protein|tara:strand:- start:903 stop:1154 length:252 start_codon:yes stop_codon:yes gene_type:complete
MVEFSFEQLNKFMLNLGNPQFNYDSFKAAHDHDNRVKQLIKDFTQDTVELKTSEVDDLKPKTRSSRNTVKSMAKKATNLGDNL